VIVSKRLALGRFATGIVCPGVLPSVSVRMNVPAVVAVKVVVWPVVLLNVPPPVTDHWNAPATAGTVETSVPVPLTTPQAWAANAAVGVTPNWRVSEVN